MSNADDDIQGLPAHLRDDAPHWQCSGCGRKSWAARDVGRVCAMPQPNGQTCTGRFLAPQPAPNISDCWCRKLHEGPCPQPALSGDEAKVREIADDIYRRLWKGDHDPLVQHTLLPAAVAAGRTLGREDASKECEGIAVEEMCGSKRTLSERLTGQRIVEAIIARRGSEGK